MTEYFDGDGDPMVFPPDMPEEMKAQIAAQSQRAGMIRADVELRMAHFFDSLDADQMQSLRIIMGQITRQPALAHYFEGIAVAGMFLKYGNSAFTFDPSLLGKSGVPGVDRLPTAQPPQADQAVGQAEAPAAPVADSPRPQIHPDALGAEIDPDFDPPAEPPAQVIGVPGYATSDAGEAALMAQYNVKQKEPGKPEVICQGCGLEYVSLADRMVKRPDDCHGCQEKARWG